MEEQTTNMKSDHPEALRKKIRTLIVFRVAFITLFFGSSFFFWGLDGIPNYRPVLYLIGILYLFSVFYYILLEKIKNLVLFAYIQLVIDVLFEIVLVYVTGGIDSWFSFTLILSVLAASIVLNKRAGFVIATLSSILYGALINLQLYEVLPATSEGLMEAKDYLYKIFIHTIFFYLTAFLSGYLSSRLERAVRKLEEKDIDLRTLEIFNREVLESLPSGLFTVDLSGRILLFNRSAESITGLKREDVVGRKIESVMTFPKFPLPDGRSEAVITVGRVEKIIGLGVSALKDIDGNTKGFIVIFQDLTKLKKLESEMKQKEKWAAIGELSSSIAHEIRNPLASLKGSIEMLREGAMQDNYKERLMQIALKEMERLNRIITDFLTYSRPAPPNIQRIDLQMLLDETLDLLENVHQGAGDLNIRRDYSERLDVDADPQKLRQVFWNLCINAVEAMPDKGELAVSARNAGDSVQIIFRDSGSGIDEKSVEKIFYPFFTTKEQGTGLGLAIAYRIVEEHEGRINVSSKPGIGTIFEVILPKKDEKT
jgi:two-component system, NtrC family, sensor histidine kinase PilS